MHQHPIGALSECGVLDLGLKCTHSCTFCYYSYWDGSTDQFAGMRKAPWRTMEELTATLDDFRRWGLTRLDITGGEPTLFPHLGDVVAYANAQGLRPRVITLGQFLAKKMRGSARPLIDDLYDAGLREFLFSTHAVDEELFRHVTKESFARLRTSMELATERGMDWFTNTVVHQHNMAHLPDIARFLAQTPVRIVNFIVMKVEFSWANERDKALERKASYTAILPHLREAIAILEAAGKPVNIRYGPYCAYKGLEKHLVGFKGIQLDPYEWRNGLRGGKGDGPYGARPFLFFKSLEEYTRQHPQDVETKPGYNMTFGPKCGSCALRHVCDGVDKDYVRHHGWDEFEPYAGAPVTDLAHFRRANPGAFLMPDGTAPDLRPASVPAEGLDAAHEG